MTKPTLDKQGRPVVVVTGMGLTTSLGKGQAGWEALLDGQSGIKPITRFPTDKLRSSVAATVDEPLARKANSGYEHTRKKWRTQHCVERTKLMGWETAFAALRMAGFDDVLVERDNNNNKDDNFPGSLFIAASPSEFEWSQFVDISKAGSSEAMGYSHMLDVARNGDELDEAELMLFATVPNYLAKSFNTQGMPISVCTACASGATAIGLGVEAIRRGDKAALCIGTDSTVHQEAMVRFSLLSAVSPHNDPPEAASRPFDKTRAGFVIAEGAAALVLEDYDHAKARGAEILGVVRGYGERADSFHRTRSMPDGSAMIGAMENTLQDAGVTPQEVDHVNAHGTSTPENDKMEALSLNKVFGEHMMNVPVSSNKGQIGHCLLAAGAVEAVISLLTIKNGIIPANMNYHTPDPAINLDIVANEPRQKNVNIILSNSFGFGGQNACLVFSSGDEYA